MYISVFHRSVSPKDIETTERFLQSKSQTTEYEKSSLQFQESSKLVMDWFSFSITLLVFWDIPTVPCYSVLLIGVLPGAKQTVALSVIKNQ